jgi:hypothetical protein
MTRPHTNHKPVIVLPFGLVYFLIWIDVSFETMSSEMFYFVAYDINF